MTAMPITRPHFRVIARDGDGSEWDTFFTRPEAAAAWLEGVTRAVSIDAAALADLIDGVSLADPLLIVRAAIAGGHRPDVLYIDLAVCDCKGLECAGVVPTVDDALAAVRSRLDDDDDSRADVDLLRDLYDAVRAERP